METIETAISGATVFWSLREGIDRLALSEALTRNGFTDLIPDLMPWGEALERALKQLYTNKRQFIRPLGAGRGFAVITEEEQAASAFFGGKTLDHDTRFEVRLLPRTIQSANQGVSYDGVPGEEADRIRKAVAGQRRAITSKQLSQILSEITRRIGAVPLRESGGIYWVPMSTLPKWQQLSTDLRTEGIWARLYTQRTVVDEDSRQSIIDAIHADLRKALAQLQEDMTNGVTDQKKAREARKLQLGKQIARMRDYESSLGITLTACTEALDLASVVIDQCASSEDSEAVIAAVGGLSFNGAPVTQPADDLSAMLEV